MHKRKVSIAHGLLCLCVAVFLAGCGSSSSRHFPAQVPPGGDGGTPQPPSGGGGYPEPPQPPIGNVVVSGTITYDRVQFDATVGNGLDHGSILTGVVRGATVEAVSTGAVASIVGVTRTDGSGHYSLTLLPNANVFLRVKAEMAGSGTPGWTFRVRDNTDGNALYALQSAPFNTGATATLVRDLRAASGWDSVAGAYSPDPAARAAAPFAILDNVYDMLQLLLSADPQAALPALDLYWSPANIPDYGVGDPAIDYPAGHIGTTFFEPGTPASSIYVLGDADVDTDEFDGHVIAHELGHYYQAIYSRDDSIGGPHGSDERLDLRVAFSEGWGDAFSGIVLGDPEYRDSYDIGQSQDGGANMESDVFLDPADRGWFSEGSVAQILYDLFDGGDADDDTVELGFAPLHAAMIALQDADAFTGIHPFVNRLVPLVSVAEASALGTLLTAQNIGFQLDDFATLEANDGGDADFTLPIYTAIAPGQAAQVCSTGGVGQTYNRLGNRRFLRMTLAAPYVGTLDVTTPDPDSDADVILYRRGLELDRGEAIGDDQLSLNLEAGTYLIEVYESSNVYGDLFDPPPFGDICIDVTLSP